VLGALDEEVIMRPTIRPTSQPTSRRRTLATTVIASAVLLAAAACGSTAPQPSASPAAAGAAASKAPSASSMHEVSALKTASTPLGDVVTDGNGMTLYLFTNDTKGTTKSACTGQCLGYWPPALVGSTAPKTTGISGTVGSIAAPGGGKQVTLNGWPLYYYAQDKAAGDVLGQGVMNIWWVVDTSGNPIKGAGGSSSTTSGGGSVGGY
jgi:predicted lipoprotein with Yx(FWY)xxD motif